MPDAQGLAAGGPRQWSHGERQRPNLFLLTGTRHGAISFFQNKDGSYTGFIKVQLKLVRPVSVPSSKKPPTLQDARRGLGRSTAVKRRTSFYLPKDAVKHLHVLSRTRAREVIEALLRKFLVVDDPRKFALFERAERHGQGGLSTSPHLGEGINACTC